MLDEVVAARHRGSSSGKGLCNGIWEGLDSISEVAVRSSPSTELSLIAGSPGTCLVDVLAKVGVNRGYGGFVGEVRVGGLYRGFTGVSFEAGVATAESVVILMVDRYL